MSDLTQYGRVTKLQANKDYSTGSLKGISVTVDLESGSSTVSLPLGVPVPALNDLVGVQLSVIPEGSTTEEK